MEGIYIIASQACILEAETSVPEYEILGDTMLLFCPFVIKNNAIDILFYTK